MIRVFPRRTKATPDDDMAFVGDPPLFRPAGDTVHVSCTFTWDRPEAERLQHAWAQHYPNVRLGGPAYGDPGDEFVPGRYLKPGYVITSRGCPGQCKQCLVPGREGPLRTLRIHDGWDVMDNNLLACPQAHVRGVFQMLGCQPRAARLTGGLEASRIDDEVVEMLAGIRLDCLFLAYDRPRQAKPVADAVARIRSRKDWSDGTARHKLNCYVLVGGPGDTVRKARERLEWIRGMSVRPFPMLWQPATAMKRLKQTSEWREMLWFYIRPAATFAGRKAADA